MAKKKKARKKRRAPDRTERPPPRPTWQWGLLILFGLAIGALAYWVVLGDMSKASQDDLQQREAVPAAE